jgi:phage terminase large subunit GpA-like protein
MTPTAAQKYDWLPQPPPRRFRLMPGEKAVMRALPECSAWQWAQGERHVEVSPLPGPMDLDITPYLVGLMEIYSHEHTREMFIAGGSQSAKTDLMHTCWAYSAVHDPGPALIAMQDRDTGSETLSDRLTPMIHHTPSLRRLRTKNPDDISMRRIRLRNGMVTYLAWANSEGRLASKPIRYGYFDEVDLWPESSIRKARARLRAFEDSYKIIEACTSSTEQGRIWQARDLAKTQLEYWPICPHCGQAHIMDFSNIQWDAETVDPADLADKGSAWYNCPHCQQKWDEEDRNQAVRLARQQHDPPHIIHGWRPRNSAAAEAMPSRVWAHISPLISRFVPFNKIAAAYLLTLVEPSAANLQYFYNDCLGVPVPEDDQGELTNEKELYQRRSDYAPPGASWQVPMAACVVTADADIQANRIEVEAVAWGHGHQSWGIEYKTFFGDTSQDEVWDQLHTWAQETTYTHETGAPLHIVRLGVDIGYRTDQASKFIKRSRKYLGHKGSNTRGLPLVPRKPSKSRRYKIPFYELGTDTGKDLLTSWLSVDQPGPRCCHWHTGYDYEYFRMLCAERPKREKNRKTGKIETVWALREGFQRNEALDIRVGNIAVREILNPNYDKLHASLIEQSKEPEDTDDPPAPPKPKRRPRRKKSGKGLVSKLKQEF